MAEKPNKEANFYSSPLDEGDLQKVVGDGENNLCNSSSMASSEVNVNLSSSRAFKASVTVLSLIPFLNTL